MCNESRDIRYVQCADIAYSHGERIATPCDWFGAERRNVPSVVEGQCSGRIGDESRVNSAVVGCTYE